MKSAPISKARITPAKNPPNNNSAPSKHFWIVEVSPKHGNAHFTNRNPDFIGVHPRLKHRNPAAAKAPPTRHSRVWVRFCDNVMVSVGHNFSPMRFFQVISVSAFAGMLSVSVYAQQPEPPIPVVVQPGAPGQPTKILPPETRPRLPPVTPADINFMQGMIMHHAQAVEMTALIDSHTNNRELHTLGARINKSQSDEISFMKRWLIARGQQTTHTMHHMPGMDMSSDSMLMPGMLSAKQMAALRKAKGEQFDRLFLTGMIQHHQGALTMVKDLFDTAGAGQDAELFNFVTDVDSGQRAEIRIMQTMLGEKP
jgi:uncharacterized protein (DUF305 family)